MCELTCVPWKSGEGGRFLLVHGSHGAQTQAVRVWQQVTLLAERSCWPNISSLMRLLTCPQVLIELVLTQYSQFSENKHRAIRYLEH